MENEINDNKVTEEDFNMAKYILTILLSNRMVVMSWGTHNAKTIKNGIRLQVNGFKHVGFVEIVYNIGKDLFDVKLIGFEYEVKKELNSIYFDDLLNVLDDAVERVENYDQAVKEFYKDNMID
jgi:hypothetical protein